MKNRGEETLGERKGDEKVAVKRVCKSRSLCRKHRRAAHGEDGSDASRGSLVGGHANDRRRRIFMSPFAV